MSLKIERLGCEGTALVVVAYVPKHAICMLRNEVEASSISIWMLAGALLLITA